MFIIKKIDKYTRIVLPVSQMLYYSYSPIEMPAYFRPALKGLNGADKSIVKASEEQHPICSNTIFGAPISLTIFKVVIH